jgi:hypothetical protein
VANRLSLPFSVVADSLSWLIATPTFLPFDQSPVAIRYSPPFSVVVDNHSDRRGELLRRRDFPKVNGGAGSTVKADAEGSTGKETPVR